MIIELSLKGYTTPAEVSVAGRTSGLCRSGRGERVVGGPGGGLGVGQLAAQRRIGPRMACAREQAAKGGRFVVRRLPVLQGELHQLGQVLLQSPGPIQRLQRFRRGQASTTKRVERLARVRLKRA